MNFGLLIMILRTLNKGTNSRVMSELGVRGWLVAQMNATDKTCNGWYLRMVAPISSIVGILVL